ncbi:MAG TPA: hypothetical protein VLK37_11640 [Solirubrobacterales bacterium]|nr:hypothetical protein [Solirubrobacterales bacterium]
MARTLEEGWRLAVTAGALLAFALLLAAPPARAASQPSGELRAGALETVLRLHDLPPGYALAYGSDCTAFKPSGLRTLGAYDRWVVGNRPEGCEFGYERRFQVPGSEPTPLLVKGETINTPSDRAAKQGFRILSRLVARLTDWRWVGPIALGPTGPTATLYHFKDGFPAGRRPVSVLVWRHGKLFAALEAGGLTPADNDGAALRYAQVQQRRLEFPSPYTEAERDDTEVELDNPSLKVPVYWLGPSFDGYQGAAELQTVNVLDEDGLPGVKLELRYDGFNIETWTQQSWKRFQSSFFRKINHPRCTRTVAFEWGAGHGIISAGYRRRTFDEGCPSFPPTRYRAVAHIGGVVVGVNQTTCRCLSPGFGPYSESLRGMKAILRGLTLRPKPIYPAG